MRKSNYVGIIAIFSLIITTCSFMDFQPSHGLQSIQNELDIVRLDGSSISDEDIKADRLIVVSDKSFCLPCRALEPILNKLKGEGYQIKIVKPAEAPFQVSSIPTIIFYREGQQLRYLTGLRTELYIRSAMILPLE